MENIKILIDGMEKEVFGIFYIFNSKYYFIYTEKEIDENGYVVLYMTQIGKETQSTPTGVVETGYMVGAEITDLEEQKNVQNSISLIVSDKKTGMMIDGYTIVLKGDVTGDGQIRVNDIMKISKYTVEGTGISESYKIKAADVIKDGHIKVNDIMKISKYTVEGGEL